MFFCFFSIEVKLIHNFFTNVVIVEIEDQAGLALVCLVGGRAQRGFLYLKLCFNGTDGAVAGPVLLLFLKVQR